VTQYIGLEGLKSSVTLPEIGMEEETVALSAVTVTASAVTNRIDRKLVFPSEQQVNASNNGVDLLRQLMLPRLQINPLTRDVSIPGGGEVQLRINGVTAELNDVIALLPKDVIRIEYHDNPGLRYGHAAAVIDYIVRRHETGGHLGINIVNTPQLKKYGDNGLNARFNRGKSEFAVNYTVSHRNYSQAWRDSEETFHFADGTTLRRKEDGIPGRFRRSWQNLNATYSFLNDRRMFNATFRYVTEDLPYWGYDSKLYNMENPDDYVQSLDLEKSWLSRPALDLYYREHLKNDQTLMLNLVGTYNKIDNERVYTESREDILLTDIHNRIAGNKYSWIGEGIYEKKLGDNRLSAGLRHMQAWSDNTYGNGQVHNTEMQQGETFLYGEWKGHVKKLDYTLGVGVTRSSFLQDAEGVDYSAYMFNPRLALFRLLPGNSSVRLTAGINTSTPSLSELSAVEQAIDSFQIQRGNPNLKSSYHYRTELNYEWRKGLFQANLMGRYWYHPKVVMEEKFLEGDKIVKTWDNQKDWQFMSATLNLRAGPIKDILTVGFDGALYRYISNGNTYRHVYTRPFFSTSVTGNYKNFTLQFFQTIAWIGLYGESLNGSDHFHSLSLDYKYRDMSFGVGIFSPFSGNFRQELGNRSAYASYERTMYMNDLSRMVTLRYSWNVNFGRAFQSGQKRLNNADEDAGIMKAGK
jgi:hypothetical protein